LLDPAIELASESGLYGDYAFVPVAFGFVSGALFVVGSEKLLPANLDIVSEMGRQKDAQYKKTDSEDADQQQTQPKHASGGTLQALVC
jgi:hypothetical protein